MIYSQNYTRGKEAREQRALGGMSLPPYPALSPDGREGAGSARSFDRRLELD